MTTATKKLLMLVGITISLMAPIHADGDTGSTSVSITKEQQRRLTRAFDTDSAEEVREALAFLADVTDVEAKEEFLQSYLRSALYYGPLDIVRELVAAGANVHKEAQEFPLVEFALSGGNAGIALYLMDCGIDAQTPREKLDEALLFTAARYGDVETVRTLIERGADVNALPTQGLPLLHAAVCPDMVKVECDEFEDLLDVYEDVDAARAFMAKNTSRCIEIMQLLLRAGVDINAKDTTYGWTPLQLVCCLLEGAQHKFEHAPEERPECQFIVEGLETMKAALLENGAEDLPVTDTVSYEDFMKKLRTI